MSQLAVEHFDPREREGDIRALFARNDSPGFEAVFERMYRPRAATGLRSWVGTVDGRVVMHISVSPVAFGDGHRTLTGGILSDLMVDPAHRDFWAPLRMLRTVVADVKREGQIDFLLTTTIPDAASLFKAGGFKPFDRLRRFVLPLLAPYLGFARLRAGATRRAAVPRLLDASALPALLPTLDSEGAWRPLPCAEFYATRIPRSDYADGTWLAMNGEEGKSAGWALLSRHSAWPEVAVADGFWSDGPAGLVDLVQASARWARVAGFPKLSVSTFGGSRVAQEFRRAGFFSRDYGVPVLLQQVGAGAPPPVEDWFLTGLALSTW